MTESPRWAAVQGGASVQNDAGLFWMIPQPVRWVAAGLGGVLYNMNPFRHQPSEPPQATGEQPLDDTSVVSLGAVPRTRVMGLDFD